MQLTYRGIKYQTNLEITPADRNCLAANSNPIAVAAIRYYTYRGISYIKYPVIGTKQKKLRIL